MRELAGIEAGTVVSDERGVPFGIELLDRHGLGVVKGMGRRRGPAFKPPGDCSKSTAYPAGNIGRLVIQVAGLRRLVGGRCGSSATGLRAGVGSGKQSIQAGQINQVGSVV